MYIVISKWEPLPGQREEFLDRSRKVRESLRRESGIVLFEHFFNEDGQAVAVVGYKDEETYHRIAEDPQGAFAQALVEHGLEDCARWVSSERGVSTDSLATA
jgi:quinol monooxygenase YgiN